MSTEQKLIPLLAGIALAMACNNKPQAPASRYDKIATGFCECTAQLVALNNQAATIDSSGNGAALFKQMETEYNKAKECSATIVAQYGKLKKEEFAELEKALAGKCPDLIVQRDLMREMLGE